jgi:23S rRNA pseudouridine1911/1915/1917 synthase
MNTKTEKLTCTTEQAGIRLDKFLFTHLPDYSRTYFHDLIKGGQITVNQIPIKKPSYSLKESDVVVVTFPPPKKYNLTPQKVDFEVVDVQPDFIVVNKPAGLVVHASESNKNEISLVNGLLYYFKELKELLATTDDYRPGIVHRIDRDTSGLLLVARTQKGQITLGKMFHDRQIHKTYVAVVEGHPPRDGSINLAIGRNRIERHKMSHAGICSREALTHYKTLAYYPDHALVAATIITGRTHQIRVHFAAIGHPVVGDQTYGKKSSFIKRQALHAWHMAFTYQDKEYCYSRPLPQDIKMLIQKIRI